MVSIPLAEHAYLDYRSYYHGDDDTATGVGGSDRCGECADADVRPGDVVACGLHLGRTDVHSALGGMTTYLLRDVDPDLWWKFKERAARVVV